MTFRQSRFKLAVVFALTAIAALVMAFFGFVSAFFPGLWAAMGLGIFAPMSLALAIAAWRNGHALAQPASIIADDRGVSFQTRQGSTLYAWDQIADFTVFSPTSRLRSPGLELKEAVNGRRFISFGRNWEKLPEEITQYLHAAMKVPATSAEL